MITLQNEKLIIEINHPCPKDFNSDLKEALIGTIQCQDPNILDKEKNHFIISTLLELLKHL